MQGKSELELPQESRELLGAAKVLSREAVEEHLVRAYHFLDTMPHCAYVEAKMDMEEAELRMTEAADFLRKARSFMIKAEVRMEVRRSK